MSITEDHIDKLEEVHDDEMRAATIGLVKTKVARNRDQRIRRAADLMLDSERAGRSSLSTDDYRTFTSAIDDAAKYDGIVTTLEKMETESHQRAAVVTWEAKTYGPGSHRNFWRDQITRADGHGEGVTEATEALRRYSLELDVDSRSKSPQGEYVRRVIREHTRGNDAGLHRREERAVTSGSTSMGAFVTPLYDQEYGVYRMPPGAFAGACTQPELDAYGLEVYLPVMTSGAGVQAQEADTYGVLEDDPDAEYLSVALTTQAGQITISQQLFDRAGPGGFSEQQVWNAQLLENLGAEIDSYALTTAIGTGATVTDSTAVSIQQFYTDQALAREQLSDTAGTRLRATHLFTTSDIFGYFSHQLDSEGRPLIVPNSAALVAVADDPKWETWTGVHMPGAVAWHMDDNLLPSGSNAQLVMARPSEVYLWKSEPIAFVYPQTLAASLSVVIGIRSYVGVIARYPKAVATISGNTYPTSLV